METVVDGIGWGFREMRSGYGGLLFDFGDLEHLIVNT